MIINHPVLNRFSPSIREVEPQLNDDKVIIPNVFQLTGLPPEPLYIAGVINSTQESSFTTGNSFTVANGGPTNLTLCALRNGYWKIRMSGAYLSNYTSVLQGGDFQLLLTSGCQMVTLYAFPGVQSFNTEAEFLLPSNTSVQVLLNTNGVGQSHQASVHLICNKLL